MGENPSLQFCLRRCFGLESLNKNLGRYIRIKPVSTREDVYCCVTIFGPGVYANVRFSYRKDSGDSKRAKLVKRLTYDRGSDSFRCSDQSGSNVRKIVKKALVALLELKNKLST